MKYRFLFLIIVASMSAYAGAQGQAAATAGKEAFVSTRGTQFMDAEGRHLILHGANVINKSRADNYQPRIDKTDFERMRAWGWNCIRLGILWDGVEPEINRYDEAYLQKLDQWIEMAQDHGFYVFLDMHQDLYSWKYSDGAPEWATLTDGMPHPEGGGGVWDDAYITSPAIQRAFDNFWDNAPCADGVGVQDHFAAMWKMIAERYRNNTTVIGYDLFNEPNIGSGNLEAMSAILDAYVRAIAEKDGADQAPTADQVLLQWMTNDGRSSIMARLRDMDIYHSILEAGAPVFVAFEKNQMTPMFQRVRNAIRSVDNNHIIFLETSMSANMGIPTGVFPLTDEQGNQDPLQAYAPHAYDIVVDTGDLALASDARLELIYSRHAETGAKMNMPVLIGEWGAFGSGSPAILPTARFNAAMMEKHLLSDTYWDYGSGLGDGPCREVFQRPIPVCVNGTILSWKTDFEGQGFSCTWRENPETNAPTRIYLPANMLAQMDRIRLTPENTAFHVEKIPGDNGSGHLVIAPTGKTEERTLQVQSVE